MLLTLKTASQPVGTNRRIAIQDGRLSAALGQLATRLGTRDEPDKASDTRADIELQFRFHGIDDTWRRLSENLVSAQDTLSMLESVDSVLAEISQMVSLAQDPSVDGERRAQLQERVDLLRPRFAALDSLALTSVEAASQAQKTVDRAYEALYEFREQVDGILANLEIATENLRLAAAAWSPNLSLDRVTDNVRVITKSIRSNPDGAVRAQAATWRNSAITLLKP